MKSTTLRRLAVVAVVLILGVVSIVLIQRLQVSRLGRSNLVEADQAAEAGELERAEELYQQHMRIFPADIEAQLKYVKVLLDRSKTPARIGQAVGIYDEVLSREPGRDEVRRRLAEILVESGSAHEMADARSHLSILLRATPEDGDLEYLMGRCEQAAEDDREAVESYRSAAAHGAAQRFDALQRAATLLRGRLNDPAEADDVIESMVAAAPDDHRVYLERGRYRLKFQKTDEDLKAAETDFRKALERAPTKAEAYIELAGLAQRRTPPDWDEAAKILQQGLKLAPESGELYLPLAVIELRAGKSDEAVATLRRGLDILPNNIDMRLGLADILAQRGETTALKEQVDEFDRLGLPFYTDFYTAYYYINTREWVEARRILTEKLIPLDLASNPALRASVNELMARCLAHLGDPERQRGALSSAVRDNPGNIPTRLAWIADIVSQGDVAQAIDEYGKLVDTVPQARVPLFQLLIARNQNLPAARRDWSEAERLITLTAKDAAPSLPVVMKAQLLQAQGDAAEAKALLDKARDGDPRDAAAIMVWTASADLATAGNDHAGALKLLDAAQAKLGDSLELRLARMRTLAARGGSDLADSLVALTDVESFEADQKVALSEAVAGELARRGEIEAAAKVWSRVAALRPQDLRSRIQLLALAFQTKNDPTPADLEAAGAKIEKALAEIEKVEGPDGNSLRHGQIEYKLWRAKNAGEAERSRFLAEARAILGELSGRRPDWSVIPVLTARIEEMEPDRGGDKQQKLSRLADLYVRAIEMGQRSLPVVQRATELLMESGRTSEVNQLWSKVPGLDEEAGGLGVLERSMLGGAIRDKDYQGAVDIVRRRIESRPNDLSERVLLAQLLLWQEKLDEAEAELRTTVDLDRDDPARWLVLVQFLASTKQIEKAERVAGEVAQAVGADEGDLAAAQCADMVGQGHQAAAHEEEAASWYDKAKALYLKALTAKPNEATLKRTYVEFLLRTNQLGEVETQLAELLKQPANDKNAEELAWAKRTLALTLVARSELNNDYQQALKALHLFAPPGDSAWKQPEAAEDLRVLSRVYEAQKILPYRKAALEVLEKLRDDGQATTEDRFLLARLHAANGEWAKAQTEYRELMREAEKPAAPQEINRRIAWIIQYASELIARIQDKEGQADATEAQDLVDRLRKIQPDAFNVLALQARLDKATGKIDKALADVKVIADRPGLPSVLALATAELAEQLGLNDLAESVFQKNASQSPGLRDHLAYAAFLGREGRTKEALDVCEPLWKSSPNPEAVAPTMVEIIYAPKANLDETQISRVSEWVGRSLEQNPSSALLMIALGNVRERQKRYGDAEDLYRKAIAQGSAGVIPLNNLAWLMTLQDDKGGKETSPLDLINRAIALRGPIPEFLDTRAVVYMTNGENQKAIEDLENAIAIAPSATKYFHLAQAQLQAGDVEAAKRSLAQARADGLEKGTLHPLEHPVYERVASALE